MAQPPSFLDKAKFVWSFVMNPCSTTQEVFIDAWGFALRDAILVYIGTSTDDFVRSIFKPKGLRAGRHGRRGSGKRRRGGYPTAAIPEVSETVGGYVNELTGYHQKKWGSFAKALFLVDNVAQEALYKIMVVNLVNDYAYDIAWGIAENDDSKCPILPRAKRHATTGIILGLLGWETIALTVNDYQENGMAMSLTGTVLSPVKYHMIWVFEVTNTILFGNQWMEAVITTDSGHNNVVATSGRQDVKPNGTQTYVVSAALNAGENGFPWVHTSGGHYDVNYATCVAIGVI